MSTTEATRLIYFGGLGEVGQNLVALERDEDIIVIDCGIGFPEPEQPGVDLVLPDISYLRARSDRIRAIFITHGHEDHIGGLPFLLPDLPATIYATRLTLGLISVKLEEANLLQRADLIELDPDSDEVIQAGCFRVQPFRVSHSIPDAVGYGVDTPDGLIVFTGDFKFDPTPIDNRTTDFVRLQSFGDRGVRLLVSDCVHVESPGVTPSERVVGDTYHRVFADAPGRIIIATFASLISRIQQVIDVSHEYGRKVVPLGRSLERNVQMALELGYLNDPNGVLITQREATQLPDHELSYVVTGSQGEPMAVLSRIANGEHRDIQVGEGDTVIISATPIPGNETAVYRIIDRLFRAGAEVIYPQRALVHVSGHASRDELHRMIELTRPRHVMPCHGEHRHMALYADLAIEYGLDPEQVTFAENGDVVEITPETIRITDHIDLTPVLVDGSRTGIVSESTVRDRLYLSRDGVIVISMALDTENNVFVGGPSIMARGIAEFNDDREVLQGLRQHLILAIAEDPSLSSSSIGFITRKLKELSISYLNRESRRRPVVMTQVVEVTEMLA